MLNNLLIVSVIALPLALAGCKKASDDESGDQAAAKTVEAEPANETEREVESEAAKKSEPEEAKSGPHEVEGVKDKLDPDEVESLLADGRAHVFDANSEKTRSEYGVVPGAKLLTSYKDYDLGILPEDKGAKLIFYCSNLRCGAAGKGAKRAVVAGYTDVNLMPVGIMGWKEAGKKTDEIKVN